eukprot:7330991-Prorocentrum_lima.AAC.1
MSAHSSDEKRVQPVSTTSAVRSMWHDAHVCYSWSEPVSSRYVSDRRTPQGHLFCIGHLGMQWKRLP